jgi:RNA polymerase sigma factor (TIGR02999 family)
MSDITLLFNGLAPDDPHTGAELLPLVYNELRQLAVHRLAREAPGHTLEPTALVHEAYLRLVRDTQGDHWGGRDHFFAAAAKAMRRILVENARRKRTLKRGSGVKHQTLDQVEPPIFEPREDLLALDQALTELAVADRAAADLVQLRYFGDLSMSEAAQVLGISQRTAERLWTYARAWLRQRLEGSPPDRDPS